MAERRKLTFNAISQSLSQCHAAVNNLSNTNLGI